MTWWRHVVTLRETRARIGSGNGLAPNGTKPLTTTKADPNQLAFIPVYLPGKNESSFTTTLELILLKYYFKPIMGQPISAWWRYTQTLLWNPGHHWLGPRPVTRPRHEAKPLTETSVAQKLLASVPVHFPGRNGLSHTNIMRQAWGHMIGHRFSSALAKPTTWQHRLRY